MQIDYEIKLGFDDVLIRPKRSKMASRKLVDLTRTYTGMNSKQEISGVPIIAANMDTVGTLSMAKELAANKMFTCLHKFYELEKLIYFWEENPAAKYTFYTTGILEDDINKLKKIRESGVNIRNICVDVANGYTEFFQNKVKEIRELFPDSIVMAGNVVTPEMVQELLLSGAADIVKIGIGPGSVCNTRIVTGVGYPQLSAIIECADAAHGLGGLVCADGGCKTPGDVAKAFAAGADFVMLGGMFAGCDECEGEWTEKDGKKYLKFYGMSSKEAMDKYSGGISDYRASEGDCITVPYKSPVREVVQYILGGLRSTCAYVGASKLKDLSKCTTFVRCTSIK
jgi:GMP reductase